MMMVACRHALLKTIYIEDLLMIFFFTFIKNISQYVTLSRFYKPDYYLVLPWHFKKKILLREKSIIRKGTKFIFPLPKLEIF